MKEPPKPGSLMRLLATGVLPRGLSGLVMVRRTQPWGTILCRGAAPRGWQICMVVLLLIGIG